MKDKSLLVIAVLVGGLAGMLVTMAVAGSDGLVKLPAPQVSEGERGQLGIDKNINEGNIDKYLGRSDAVYRDMRMLIDPGNYEAIGVMHIFRGL